jgi:hypothetical protein
MKLSVNIFALGYVFGVLRGTRELLIAEGRSIATVLRREYPKLFALSLDVDPSIFIIDLQYASKKLIFEKNHISPLIVTSKAQLFVAYLSLICLMIHRVPFKFIRNDEMRDIEIN